MTLPSTESQSDEILGLAVNVVSAYLAHNKMQSQEVPGFIQSIYICLHQLDDKTKPAGRQQPAVDSRKSISKDYIICLEDGKKFKSLKRHLRVAYSMSPEEYRMKWGLPSDYPMVAPSYAKIRSEMARKMGLGRR